MGLRASFDRIRANIARNSRDSGARPRKRVRVQYITLSGTLSAYHLPDSACVAAVFPEFASCWSDLSLHGLGDVVGFPDLSSGLARSDPIAMVEWRDRVRSSSRVDGRAWDTRVLEGRSTSFAVFRANLGRLCAIACSYARNGRTNRVNHLTERFRATFARLLRRSIARNRAK